MEIDKLPNVKKYWINDGYLNIELKDNHRLRMNFNNIETLKEQLTIPVVINSKIMEWISIKDKLPTRENGYDWVLVIAKMNPENYFGVPAVAELINSVWYFRDFDKPAENELSIKITHWMDLPKPPTE